MARPKRIDQIAEIDQQVQPDPEGIVNLERVRTARRAQLPANTLLAVSELFAALGDPTRLRIIAALEQREMCVCDISAAIELSASAASHQLRTLRDHGLVKSRKLGRHVYYSLDDEHVAALYQQARDHINHQDRKV